MRRVATSALRSGRSAPRRYTQHAATPEVKITTLPNGLRVATEPTPSHFTSVGLYLDAGSRYETPTTSGVSHFLDRLAFQSTKARSSEEMAKAIDKVGGQMMCSASREAIMYQSTHFSQANPLAMNLISDTVLQPAFLTEEIEAQKDAARYEIREMSAKPEMVIPEVLHSVAYNGGLGNPILCPEERISSIESSLLHRTMEEWYQPHKMVLAGAGLPHEELVELADKHFSSLKSAAAQPTASASSTGPSSRTNALPPHILSPAQPSVYKSLTRAASSYLFPTSDSNNPLAALGTSNYTGGYRFIHDPKSEFDHVYVAFEGVGIHDEDIYTLATMQILLGGGGSFSAGGPGKGMYSRLYTHILNHYHQVDHCSSFHHIYADSSLFGLFASFLPSSARGNSPAEILPHLAHQLSLLLYSPVPEQELSRARNQLKSSLMMALESQAVQVEDLGRQILVHGRRIPITEMTDAIDKVTPEAVRRVATRLFGAASGRQATIVCMGQQDLGDYKPTLRKYGLAGSV